MSEGVMIHVIDDDEAVRDSLGFLFDTSDMPARTWASAAAFLSGVETPRGGCVVTDVRMPGMSGIELLRELKIRRIDLPVIVITGHGDVPMAVEAMRAGAVDFLEKPFAEDHLLDAVRRALARSPGPGGVVVENAEQARVRARLARLSDRERQVLTGLVAGQLNKTIAHDLGISVRTVEVYRAKLMTKMEADAFADLVRMALVAGDVDG
ncbi:MAG: response regulator FixJ [Caulobacter sp.]|nr:response regulator FixJ [Caulobacter sp.]